MLDRSTVERLRGADTSGHPVVSVYLGLGPDLCGAAAGAARAGGGAVRYVLAATPPAHVEAGALVRFPVASVGE